jgi:6-phosphogluconolactonase
MSAAYPPTDPQSNYKLAKEHYIDPAGFPASNVHRIQAELEPETAARLYSEDIRKFFRLEPGSFPAFDIIHRGMGPDAHSWHPKRLETVGTPIRFWLR